ncbi:conserved hypothetical protein [Xenorhabdus innexi]|uniref:Uncharacterized protein n=1 Tax=Xenorhabdus innexi TaxID=290109 RepID=A0A1N6MSD9_9GAMM|nr:conserved hypothetical protein [Xenorhabdus innexi]
MINLILYNELIDDLGLWVRLKSGIAGFTLWQQGVKLITFPTISL